MDLCVDFGCIMSLIDRKYLTTMCKAPINRTANPVRVRGIGSAMYDSSEYAFVDFYVPDSKNGNPVIAHFRREVHVVDDLKANVLIEMDILGPEKMDILTSFKQCRIGSCEVTVPLIITSRGQRVERAIRASIKVTVPPHSVLTVSVRFRESQIPNDRDYAFEPKAFTALSIEGGFFAHILSANVTAVQIRNTFNEAFIVPKNFRVRTLSDYHEEGCYAAHPEDAHLAIKAPGWISTIKKWVLAGAAAMAAMKVSSDPILTINTPSDPVQANYSLPASSHSRISMETVMFNEITVFGDQSAYARLSTVAEAYPTI